MANEIRITGFLEAIKDNFTLARSGKSFSVDMDGVGGGTPGMVILGLVEQSINLEALTRPGWVMMQNIDDAAYVDWGAGPYLGDETGTGSGTANDGLVGRMEAGEFALFRLHPAVHLTMRASAEQTRVLIFALED
jgi:hypothetical protein